jgi:16S rRNA (guanine1207-N2)-methyltransferase
MADTRLSLALDQGLLPDLPRSGAALWFGLPDPFGAALLPGTDLTAVQPVQPAASSLEAAGLRVLPEPEPDTQAEVAIVTLPRARARAQLWIAQAAAALPEGGWLIVDGAKTDGVDSLFKACRKRLDDCESFTKAHGRLFWAQIGQDRFEDWLTPDSGIEGFQTGPGVFSADGIDPASALLAAALPALKGRVADLGAGWGFLSSHILKSADVSHLDLVEADHMALSSARRNLDDARASFHWADATAWQPAGRLDAVVMNPPFHTGRAGDPGLGKAFIAAASRALSPQGKLWLVANRHLPYEAELEARFRGVQELEGTRSFKLYLADGPRRQGKGARA